MFLNYSLLHSYDDKNPSTLYEAAAQPEALVPIRLDIDIEGQKLRDTFTWNKTGKKRFVFIHFIAPVPFIRAYPETMITPEQFAEVLCDDLDLPSSQFVSAIASSIRHQCDQFTTDMIPEDEEDRRVIIKVGVA